MKFVPIMSCVGKLRELNNTAPQDHKLSEAALDSLEKLLFIVTDPKKEQPTPEQIGVLWKASHWPEGKTLNKISYCTADIIHIYSQFFKKHESGLVQD